MTFIGLKLVGGSFPPKVRDYPLPTIISTKIARPLQVASEEGQKCQALKTFCVSRRDAMICLTAETLIGHAFFATEPASARIVKPETRKKIFEKLEKLREEAGISKPKTDDGNSSSPAPPSGKDTELQASPPSRNPVKNPVVVESILP